MLALTQILKGAVTSSSGPALGRGLMGAAALVAVSGTGSSILSTIYERGTSSYFATRTTHTATKHSFDERADQTLGHLSHQLKRIFAQNPGFSTRLSGETLSVSMADGGHLLITKLPKNQVLEVDSKFTDLNEPGHDQAVAKFKLDDHGKWISGKQELHTYLENGFTEYLKMLVELDEEELHRPSA